MARLVKITLKNFKSFRKAEIPISKGFTAIVGSNGSGKSNVLDALLFVLGMTSLKTLRASKLVDLINNSSRENYAKVDLVIKQKDTEYEVSRMVDSQSKSVYRLNGKRTTLNEISSLLTELGIDVFGHNIVTQGDITKVIEMSPEGRREIIDTLAGLSEFNEKKDEAIRELSKVEARTREATIVLNERSVFLAELEKEMKAAEEYGALESEKRKVKATIIQKEINSLEKESGALDEKISTLRKEIAEGEKEIEKGKAELDGLKKRSSELSGEMMRAAEETYSKHGKALEEKKAKFQLEKEKIEMNSQLISKNSEKISENNSEIDGLSKEKIVFEQRKKELEQKLSEISNELKNVSEERGRIETIVRAKSSELAKRENKVDETNKKIGEMRKEIFTLEVAAKQWEKQKAFHEKKLAELADEERSISEEMQSINQKKNKIREYSAGRDLEEAVSEMETAIENLNENKNKSLAIEEQEKKSINALKGAVANCPVCDSTLGEDKKTSIISSKIKIAADAEADAKKIAGRISAEKEKLSALRKRLALVARLSAEISNENGVADRLEEMKRKIRAVKGELDRKTFEEKIRERNKMNEKINALLSKLEQAKESLKVFRSQNIFENFTNITGKREELQQKKNSIETQLNEIKSKLADAILPKEKRLADENAELSAEIKWIETKIRGQKNAVEKIEKEIQEKERDIEKAKEKTSSLAKEKEAGDREEEKAGRKINETLLKIKKIEARMNELNLEKSRSDVRIGDLKEEAKEFGGTDLLYEKNIDELKKRLPALEERIAKIGAVNLKAVNNFNQLKKDVEDIRQKADKLTEERLAVLDMIDKIEVKRTTVFMNCFNEINKYFQEMFFKFFSGEGKLSLSDEKNPLESGLMIDAKHKGDKLQNIDSMSGGEKTLTALAFMFAIQFYKPAPFYAFDEADAALDKENSLKISSLIEKISEKSQFIAITHNDPIIKKADQVVGVALARDKSSVIGLRLKNPSKQQQAQ